eukprot:CAMPEP_0174886340 /NCGR_PEP_ID=MMETSP0167-20121228/1575_1 /TAXON_ID=38298 /ORGANISM="Rhodella maculata, Strain CCMP736" /LENGTH=353 /DNA_ID=CAMNT_0016122291 /DNA_START=88 /DNA_END=1148 /DNA_ORIENTATION=-
MTNVGLLEQTAAGPQGRAYSKPHGPENRRHLILLRFAPLAIQRGKSTGQVYPHSHPLTAEGPSTHLPYPSHPFESGPVKNVIIIKPLSDVKITEHASQVGVVGLLIELQASAVRQVVHELDGESFAELGNRGGNLLVRDFLVLLLLGGGPKPLPREAAPVEVHEDEAEGLEVVSATLLDAEMGVDGGVTGGAGEILVLPVGDMDVCFMVAVLLCESKVDDVDDVRVLPQAHEKVVGLDVAVEEASGVDVLDALDHLVGEHEDGLEGEPPMAEIEEVLETGAEEIDSHDVVVALLAEPPDLGNALDVVAAGADVEVAVDFALVEQLRVLRLRALELDRDFFARRDVCSEIDIAE